MAPLALGFVIALWAAFIHAPREREMGEVQRIFYFHVGAAWNFYVCFFIVFVAGILYLWKRKRIWDQIAASAAEIGLMLTTITLLTGILWARPIWNTWWPWGDPRVTSVLVLWLIYAAYLIFRSSMPDSEKKFKYCAVFGIIGFLDIPVVHMSIRIWRTIHPVVIEGGKMNLAGPMIAALFIAVGAFTILVAVLLCLRLAQRLQSAAAAEMMLEDLSDYEEEDASAGLREAAAGRVSE